MKVTTVDGKVYENKTCSECLFQQGCRYGVSQKIICDKYADKKEWMDKLEKGMK